MPCTMNLNKILIQEFKSHFLICPVNTGSVREFWLYNKFLSLSQLSSLVNKVFCSRISSYFVGDCHFQTAKGPGQFFLFLFFLPFFSMAVECSPNIRSFLQFHVKLENTWTERKECVCVCVCVSVCVCVCVCERERELFCRSKLCYE